MTTLDMVIGLFAFLINCMSDHLEKQFINISSSAGLVTLVSALVLSTT